MDAPETGKANDTTRAELIEEVFVHHRLRPHEQLIETGRVATQGQQLSHADPVKGQVTEGDGARDVNLVVVGVEVLDEQLDRADRDHRVRDAGAGVRQTRHATRCNHTTRPS